jgi:hypothetical protein
MLKFAEKSFGIRSLLNRIQKLYTRRTNSLNPSVAKEDRPVQEFKLQRQLEASGRAGLNSKFAQNEDGSVSKAKERCDKRNNPPSLGVMVSRIRCEAVDTERGPR